MREIEWVQKMTDNEIIKALEYCKQTNEDVLGVCTGCPMDEECDKDCDALIKRALDLINRQKAENADLKRVVGLMNKRKYYRKFVDEVFRKQKGKELSEPDFDYIYQLYFEQKSEISKLKIEIGSCNSENLELKAEIKRLQRSLNETNKYLPKIKERVKLEAIKEFAERLKPKIENIPWCEYHLVHTEIDNLVKEMKGKSDNTNEQ